LLIQAVSAENNGSPSRCRRFTEHALPIPEIRLQALNSKPTRKDRDYILYWMIAFRRVHWNFALDHAIERARELKKPLVIFEALRVGYPWACDRFHRFVMDGMAEKLDALAKAPVTYYPYVEPGPDADKGLLAALAKRASVVITDDFPCFFLPRMVASAAKKIDVLLEAVDSNGLLPLRAADQTFPTAYALRRFLHKNLPAHLDHAPLADPLASLKLPRLKALPAAIAKHWPAATKQWLADPASLAALPINHTVAPATGGAAMAGGEKAARVVWGVFLKKKLARYGEDRNMPDQHATSGLSPYLHFGFLSTHQMFHELMKQEKWTQKKLSLKCDGRRSGWWGVSANAEGFLDQFITWREVGYNFSSHRPSEYESYASLPEWAQKTMAKHARDERPVLYTLKDFALARTYDPLWNAAQRQLAREGVIHNYMRMLWGKKILEWSRSPEEALEILIELNNRYALDGRNPNSYSGIFWTLGRYDRPWGPERPIFGTIRYMSSDNTARKLDVKGYLAKYGPDTTVRSVVEDRSGG
jgi:deoxyribodipyrimidine photo-lyase